jgi:hypothetical protein
MRVVAAVLLVGVLGGCTSVKMVQRDGCWVRRTEKRVLGTAVEEVGPCARPATAFVENDPLTRMVQECISRADYRWQMRALAAWDRREAWPEQLTESSVLQQCMNDAAQGILGEAATLKEKNAALEQRLAHLSEEHQALARRSDEERKELVQRTDEERKERARRADEERKELVALQWKLGEHLGEAAKKVQPVAPATPSIATATATSEGRSRTEHAAPAQPALAILTPSGATAPTPAMCVAPSDGAPARAEAPRKKASPTRQARTPPRPADAAKAPVAATDLPACDPTKTPGQTDAKVATPMGPQVAGTSQVKPEEAKAAEAPKPSVPAGAAAQAR